MGKKKTMKIAGTGDVDERGERHGMWTYTYADGQRYAQGAFSHNHPDGEWSYWYPNGELAACGSHAGEDAGATTFIGEWTLWHPNGVKADQHGYDEAGLQTGTQTEWYSNGQTACTSQWIYGDQYKDTTLWYPSGQQMAEGEVSNDIPVGTWNYWHENGQLAFVERWGTLPPLEGFFDEHGNPCSYEDFWKQYRATFASGGWVIESTWPDNEYAAVDVWDEWRPTFEKLGIDLPLLDEAIAEELRLEWVRKHHGF